jgi:hypothetical protein
MYSPTNGVGLGLGDGEGDGDGEGEGVGLTSTRGAVTVLLLVVLSLPQAPASSPAMTMDPVTMNLRFRITTRPPATFAEPADRCERALLSNMPGLRAPQAQTALPRKTQARQRRRELRAFSRLTL